MSKVSSSHIVMLIQNQKKPLIGQAIVLEQNGYHVIKESNIEAILTILESNKVSLALIDIDSEEFFDSISIAKKIAESKSLPIVFLSSNFTKTLITKTEKISNYGYVTKQSNDFVLLASIRLAIKLFNTNQQLKENEVKYHSMVSSVPGIVYRCANDKDWQMFFISDEVFKITGYSPKSFTNELKQTWTSIIHPDDVEYVNEKVQEGIKKKKRYDLQYRIYNSKGEIKWVQEKGQAVYDSLGIVSWLDGIITDISDIKLSQEIIQRQLQEKELLLKESHHRIKNNISSIISTLRLHSNSIQNEEAKSILADAISRVDNIRIIYDKLLISKNFKEISFKLYLEDLIDAIIGIFPSDYSIVVNKNISNFNLDVNLLFPIGAIINELMTNSLKHCLDKNDSIIMDISILNENNEVTLIVKDNGEGYPEDFTINKSTGFGLMIVQLLTEQLDGQFSIRNENGAKNIIKFKV